MFHEKLSLFGYNGCELLLQWWLVCYLKYNLFPFLVSWDVIFLSNWNSHPEVFLGKGVLRICSKFTGEHPCSSAISIKLLCKFIQIALWHGCSPVNLLHIFRTSFPRTPLGGWLRSSTPCVILQSITVVVFSTDVKYWDNTFRLE